MDANNVTPETFQEQVVDRSQSLPVVLLFWADQVPPSVQAKQALEGLLPAYGDKLALALSDVAVDQSLAQHLRVQGLPSIRVVHQGKIVEQIDGPVDEARLREVFDALTQSPADMLKAQLDQIIASGDFDQAVAMLQQAVNEEPNNMGFRVELADVLVRTGALDDARTVLASIPEETEGRERPQNRLEFSEEAAGMAELDELEAEHRADPDALETRYQLAVRSAVVGAYEPALQHAMAILQADRTFRDDIGRLTMIRVFDLLGKGDPLASQYRRKMFNFMH